MQSVSQHSGMAGPCSININGWHKHSSAVTETQCLVTTKHNAISNHPACTSQPHCAKTYKLAGYLFVCMCTQTSSVLRDIQKNCMFRPLNNTAGLMTQLPHTLVYTTLLTQSPEKPWYCTHRSQCPAGDLPPALAPINLQSDRAQPWLTAQQHTSPCLTCPHLTTSHAHTTKPCHQAVHAGM